MNYLASVVIPVYKDFLNLSKQEMLSLDQCINVLYKHTICFVGPNKLNLIPYIEYSNRKCEECYCKKFHSFYFSSITGYNKLLLSDSFYKSFEDYKFILIYQLDAFVFRDELEYWCHAGYDYIGAPWINADNVPVVGVGNGGFSLRNVEKSLSLLSKLRFLEVFEQFKGFSSIKKLALIPSIINKLGNSREFPSSFELNYTKNEDYFWGIAAPERVNKLSFNSNIINFISFLLPKDEFKIPTIELALKFSFETNPKTLYKMNSDQLPFGCHAWEKYDPIFWKKFIPFSTE